MHILLARGRGDEGRSSPTPAPYRPLTEGSISRSRDRLARWAETGNVRRAFWFSLAAFVAGEGLIGFFAILFNGFPKDVELARTLLSAVLCMALGLAGLALNKRGYFPRYARLTVAGAAFGFPLLVADIWVSGGRAWSNLHWSAVALLVGSLLVSAQRLWIGDRTSSRAMRTVLVATCVSFAVIIPLTIAAIWGWSPAGAARALGAFSLVAFVSFVLTPIFRRAVPRRATKS
jgi:hypothetical protein